MVDSVCRKNCRNGVERRIIARESEFWKNSVAAGATGYVLAPALARVEDHRIARSFLIERSRSRSVDALLDSVFRQVCLLKGEAYVDAKAEPADGAGFVLTNYRIIRCSSPSFTVERIMPLYDIRFYGPEADSLTEIDGATIRAVMSAEKWAALDSLSRKILVRTRGTILEEYGIPVREITGMVPAIRSGRFRLGHVSQSRLLGVCSGLTYTFPLRPAWMRSGFILLTLLFGAGAGLYLVLWAVMAIRSVRAGVSRRGYEDADITGCPTA